MEKKQTTITIKEIEDGYKMMEILKMEPSAVLKESNSYHSTMKKHLDSGFFDEDIELALTTFRSYVRCKHIIKEKMVVNLPKSRCSFSIGPGYFDLEKNEVYFNNISGECEDEASLYRYLIRRLS